MVSKETAIRLAKQNKQKLNHDEIEHEEGLPKKLRYRTNRTKVYYFSLLATDARSRWGKGMPDDVPYFFDVKSELELSNYDITFLSAQDLQLFAAKKLKIGKYPYLTSLNIYQLVIYFISQSPNPENDIYILDEVPFIKGIIVIIKIIIVKSLLPVSSV